MMKGVFLDRDSLDLGDLDFSQLEESAQQWRYFSETPQNQVLENIADADIVISNKVVLDKAIIEQATQLKLICVAATGTNNVDLDAAKLHNIQVSNVRAYGTSSVVQHVFALLLSLVRNLPAYQQAVQQGAWHNSKQFCMMDFPIDELTNKVMGIVGYGELGKGVARVAESFGMKVMVAQRPGREAEPGHVPLAELLVKADVLTLHCPLTAETSNLISVAELARMKDSAILINTARGGIVDDKALADALRNNKLAGAGIDVLETEPPTKASPLLQAGIPNLIVTPHMAWASRESRQRLLNQVAENIRSYHSGVLNNRVV